MKLGRQHAPGAFIAVLLGAAGIWLALHTEWVEVEVSDPLKGAALRDADYRLKQFATRLGAQVSTPANLDRLPPPGATLVLSSIHWNLFPERAQALRQWVEAGGHLWVPYRGRVDEALAWIPVRWVRVPTAKPAAPAHPSQSTFNCLPRQPRPPGRSQPAHPQSTSSSMEPAAAAAAAPATQSIRYAVAAPAAAAAA